MQFTLSEIAENIGAKLQGNAEQVIHGMAELDKAGPQDLCFAESSKYAHSVGESCAGAVIVGPDFPQMPQRNLLQLEQPRLGFLKAMEMFAPNRMLSGIHPSAVVAADAVLAEAVSIGPGVVIEPGAVIGPRTIIRAGAYVGKDAQLGADCDIGAHVTLLDRVRIGDRCIFHPGVVIGADGYGFQWLGDHHHKIPQLGTVVVEDDVEIGANSCIDRATLGETRIGAGSKIDNLVQVGHNNELGRHVLLISQVGIAGSCKVGNGAVLAGQVGVADHIKIGDGAQIGAQGGVTCDIEPAARVWGTPSRPIKRVLKEQAALGKLPELMKIIRSQSQELDALKARLDALEQDNR